ncbi:hypothetical protein LINPERPRIM_LOCUS34567 [Linum perenne]
MIGLYVKSIFVKICKSCFTNVCKCVIRHPIVSVISFLLLLLYLFIPIVFVFSIYASPLLVVAAAVYYWFRAKRQDAKRNGIRQEKKIEKKLSTLGKSKSVANDRPMATKPTRSMSQRRNKEKFFVEADPVIAHDVKASISDFLREVRNKRDEELAAKESHQDDGGLCFHTEIRDSKPKLEIDPPLISDRGRDTDGGGGEESGSSEDDKAVVEWNEDDQKNLMDLGISEIERNKRLESLIARRRSRKFYKMNSEKGMIADIDLVGPCTSPSVAATEIVSPASISTRIHDPLLSHASGEDLPGSAPSVLLPGKNPFDLPYDPHEEKPDLMTDSFQQEFAIAPHKEMLMCRHESFTLGHTRAIIHSGNIEEHKPPRHGDPIARTVSVTDLVTDLLEPRQPDESPSKEAPVEITTDESTVRTEEKNNDQGSEISPNPRPPSLPRPMPKAASVSDLVANDASLSIIHNARVDEHYQNRGTWHTPTNSVASDLQVEVSEVGSPPSTVGGSDSDDDRGSLTYDGDIEKEANSGSEEPLWGLSPHAPRTGKHELALRFLNEASEEGMIESRMANDFKGFDAEIRRNAKQLDKEELISRDSAVEASTTSEDHHKEVLDPLKGEMKKSNDMDGDAGNVDKVEELKSVERQTVYEIGDDLSKPAEEIVSEPHVDRELLQGPGKQADVIVKRSEEVDTSSSSTSNLEHHNDDDRGISNDSVVQTPANEASRFITDEKISTPSETQSMDDRAIAATSPISVSETLSSLQPEAGMDRQDLTNSDSLQQPGDNVRDENVQQISTPSETQSTNVVVDDRSSSSVPETMSTLQPEVGMDQDHLANSNALMSPVSVLVDMSQQEAQMSPSPISQPVHEMDESVHRVDQTPLSHNKQQPSESSTGEIDPSESLVRVNDQDHSQMELPARARDWNDEDHNVDSKGKNSTEITHNDDPGMSHDETHVKEEVSKSFEDITYSPEGTTTYGSKSEQEDTRFAEEGNNNSNNVIDEGSKEKSSSITKDYVPSEDLLAAKQEVVTELLPKPVDLDLVPSDGLQDDIIESIRQDAIAEIVKPSDVISEQTIEGESLSSVKREAVEESLKEADMISMEEQPKPVVDSVPLTTVEGNDDSLASIRQQASMELLKTDDLIPSIKPDAIVAESLKEPDSISTKSFLEGGDESMSSMKEAITSMKEQQPKPVADTVPLMTVEGNDSLASIQQEASMEPLKTADFIPSVKQAQLPADSNSISISVSSIDEPIQTEVVHTETSVPVAEAEAISSLSKSISPEQDTEHSVSEPVDPLSQIPEDKNDISHNHLQNLDPLASHDQKEDNSQSSNSAINGDQEDEGTSLAANRKDDLLIIKQHEESDQVAKET